MGCMGGGVLIVGSDDRSMMMADHTEPRVSISCVHVCIHVGAAIHYIMQI